MTNQTQRGSQRERAGVVSLLAVAAAESARKPRRLYGAELIQEVAKARDAERLAVDNLFADGSGNEFIFARAINAREAAEGALVERVSSAEDGLEALVHALLVNYDPTQREVVVDGKKVDPATVQLGDGEVMEVKDVYLLENRSGLDLEGVVRMHTTMVGREIDGEDALVAESSSCALYTADDAYDALIEVKLAGKDGKRKFTVGRTNRARLDQVSFMDSVVPEVDGSVSIVGSRAGLYSLGEITGDVISAGAGLDTAATLDGSHYAELLNYIYLVKPPVAINPQVTV